MFSTVIKAAAEKPQIITIRGKETAVIISCEEYRRIASPKKSIVELFQSSPLYGIELELPERLPEEMRAADL